MSRMADTGPFVSTRRVLLLPYTAALVPTYHAWLEDPWLREMTASERLSLEEEFAAQREWARDASKQTFIVFDRAAREGAGGAPNFTTAPSSPSSSPADAVAGAGGSAGGEEVEAEAAVRGACGDVNIFMLDADVAADYAPPPDAGGGNGGGGGGGGGGDVDGDGGGGGNGAAAASVVAAEIMVMIADPAFRRRGLAAEAVRAMMAFAHRARGVTRFVAKISDANEASLRLFARLGFRLARAMPHFAEQHLALDLSPAAAEALCAGVEDMALR